MASGREARRPRVGRPAGRAPATPAVAGAAAALPRPGALPAWPAAGAPVARPCPAGAGPARGRRRGLQAVRTRPARNRPPPGQRMPAPPALRAYRAPARACGSARRRGARLPSPLARRVYPSARGAATGWRRRWRARRRAGWGPLLAASSARGRWAAQAVAPRAAAGGCPARRLPAGPGAAPHRPDAAGVGRPAGGGGGATAPGHRSWHVALRR